MQVGQHCKRNVVSVVPNTPLTDAANLMRERSLGFLVVGEEREGRRIPVGVLTDRDIVVRVIGPAVDPETLLVKDVMSTEPVLAREDDDFLELVRGMRIAGIRRMPVIDQSGALTGIVSLDDPLELVSEMLDHLCVTVTNEQRQERRQREQLSSAQRLS